MNPYDFLVKEECQKDKTIRVKLSTRYNPYDLLEKEGEQEEEEEEEEEEDGDEDETIKFEESALHLKEDRQKENDLGIDVTRWLNKKDILKYINNTEQKGVYFSFEERCFKKKITKQQQQQQQQQQHSIGQRNEKRKETYLKGLVPVLKRIFWPTYEYVETSYKTKKNTGLKSQRHGIYRGDLVHTQIELYVNKGGFDLLDSIYGEKGIHKFTIKALLALREWKLHPVVSELLVYEESLNVATKADLLCLNSKGELVLIEWKCGMDNYFFMGNDTMKGPLETVYSNCPLNQAYIQLMFTKILLERSYNNLKITKSYVVQIQKDSIEPFSLPKRLVKNESNIVFYLERQILEHQGKGNNKRRKTATGLPG